MGTIRLFLRANERLFINGAVLRADRKVSVELLNEATFLLEKHVLQKEQATTPLRQLYFVAQSMLIEPDSRQQALTLFRRFVSGLLETHHDRQLLAGIKEVDAEVSTGRVLTALKRLRDLFEREDQIINVPASRPAQGPVCANAQIGTVNKEASGDAVN